MCSGERGGATCVFLQDSEKFGGIAWAPGLSLVTVFSVARPPTAEVWP